MDIRAFLEPELFTSVIEYNSWRLTSPQRSRFSMQAYQIWKEAVSKDLTNVREGGMHVDPLISDVGSAK